MTRTAPSTSPIARASTAYSDGRLISYFDAIWIISIKVATADGGTDVSQVIAAIGYPHQGTAVIDGDGKLVVSATANGSSLRPVQTTFFEDARIVSTFGSHRLVTGVALTSGKTTADGTGFDLTLTTGPNPVVANDVMYDVPCEQLADARRELAALGERHVAREREGHVERALVELGEELGAQARRQDLKQAIA